MLLLCVVGFFFSTAITGQDWTSLGFSEDPNVAATNDIEIITDRLTALLLVRIVAIVDSATFGKYTDLSTTTICRTVLNQIDTGTEGETKTDNTDNNKSWPDAITDNVMKQLRTFVYRIISTYQDTPYHNAEHAYHVTISINKLVDLILNSNIPGGGGNSSGSPMGIPTFGLRKDPLMHLVIIFSALIHDAEHTGVPNRQLSNEDDPLAVLYNDQSIAENRSLHIGFSELLKPEFEELRNVMFSSKDEEYRRFRKAVLNLVLSTDIASPERTQIGKSKWKEAFGDPFETVERKVRSEIKRRQSVTQSAGSGGPESITPKQNSRRASAISMASMYSEITTDIPEEEEGDEDDEDSSGSVTPDSSYGEDDFSSEGDLNRSLDGLILSGKPFESQTVSHVAGAVNEADLGYEDHHDHNKDVEPADLGYNSSFHSTDAPGSKMGSGSGHAHSNRLKAMADKAGGRTNRNMSMSSLKSLPLPGVGDSPGMYNPKQISRFQRRFSTSTIQGAATQKYKLRLGILRAVDLSGEAIESYSRSNSMVGSMPCPSPLRGGAGGTGTGAPISSIELVEEVDELKVTVIMEQLMLAADVAHNLQGWDHMVKWSNRLFLELKKAHKAGRGGDPKGNWYGNQIGFLESYLLPLARRLEDMGVFGDVIGPVFAKIVEANRDRWVQEGMNVTTKIIAEGGKQYPMEGDVTA